MPVCFVCKKVITSLRLLCSHFKIIHKLEEKCEYRCSEPNCRRVYLTLNSFKKHFKCCHLIEMNYNMGNNPATCEQIKYNILNNKENSSCAANLNTFGTSYVGDALQMKNIEIAQMGQCTPDTISIERFDEIIRSQVTILISKLYSKMTLPRSMVQEIINDFEACFLLPLEEIKSKLYTIHCSNASEKTCILRMCKSLQDLFSEVKSEYLRFKLLEKSNKFIQPEEVIVGHDMHINASNILQTKHMSFQFIPLRKSLKCFFEMGNVFDVCMNHCRFLKDQKNSFSNIIQGPLWSSKIIRATDLLFPLLIYYDEFEIGNPLGSHAGIHKLGAVYASIPVLPPEFQSQLNSIFLCMLFHSMDLKEYGSKIIFSRLVEELNFLSSQGIQIEVGRKKVNLKFQLLLLQGDNLGLHTLLGFNQSFSSKFYCRFCKSDRDVCSKLVNIDIVTLRTKENYESDLLLNNSALTGIKESCIFNKVKCYHITENLYCDIMHDLLEGVCKHTIGLVLNELIVVKQVISFEMFQLKMKYFNYGFESKNKPPLLSLENIKNKQMKLSASEMLCLCRYLALIIGILVPKENKFWKCYLLLREIVSIVTSFHTNLQIVENLKEKIIEHHKLFLTLNANGQFTPKFHFLLHLPSIIMQTGPPINLWTMRYESKHRQLKSNANVVASRVNVCRTLALKCQLKDCEMFISNNRLEKNCSYGFSNVLPTIHESRFDTELKLLLMKNSFLNNIICSSAMTSCGITYKTGNIILIFVKDNYAPIFGKILNIFQDESRNVAFIIKKIETVNYDQHVMSYRIKYVAEIDLIFLKDLCYKHPLLHTVKENHENYVSLRYSVISQNDHIYLC